MVLGYRREVDETIRVVYKSIIDEQRRELGSLKQSLRCESLLPPFIIIIIHTPIEPWAHAGFYLIIGIGNPLGKKTYAKRISLPSALILIYRNNVILPQVLRFSPPRYDSLQSKQIIGLTLPFYTRSSELESDLWRLYLCLSGFLVLSVSSYILS